MIPIRNRKKTLQVTVEEMRNFAFAYVEKYAPSKQQLKTYLLKKYMKLSSTDVRKKDVNKLIDIVLSDLNIGKKYLVHFGDSDEKINTVEENILFKTIKDSKSLARKILNYE